MFKRSEMNLVISEEEEEEETEVSRCEWKSDWR